MFARALTAPFYQNKKYLFQNVRLYHRDMIERRCKSLVFLRVLFIWVNFSLHISIISKWFKNVARFGFVIICFWNRQESQGRETKKHDFVTIVFILKFLKLENLEKDFSINSNKYFWIMASPFTLLFYQNFDSL